MTGNRAEITALHHKVCSVCLDDDPHVLAVDEDDIANLRCSRPIMRAGGLAAGGNGRTIYACHAKRVAGARAQ